MLRYAGVVKRRRLTRDRLNLSPARLRFHLERVVMKSVARKPLLWLHGVTAEGFSVALGLTDFRPTVLVKPTLEYSEEDELEAFVEDMNTKMNLDSRRQNRQYIESAEFVYMKPFVGFTNNRQDKLIKVTCVSAGVYRRVCQFLRDENFEVLHDDFSLSNQLFHQNKGTRYQAWYDVTQWIPTARENRKTHANIEGRMSVKYFRLAPEDECENLRPCVLKCGVRVKTVSHDGVRQKKLKYHPDPNLPLDRVLSVGFVLSWGDTESNTPAHYEIVSLLPRLDPDDSCAYQHVASETELLAQVQTFLQKWDPDDIVYFPDYQHPLTYLAKRVFVHDRRRDLLFWDRYCRESVYVREEAGKIEHVGMSGRSLIDLENAVKRKTQIKIENFDLYSLSCRSEFRQDPETRDGLIHTAEYVNPNVLRGADGCRAVYRVLKQDLRLLFRLEKDAGLRTEHANISMVGDTDLTDTVSRGEQIRVYNLLSHFLSDRNCYINRAQLSESPLKFPISERPPTFPDPPELKMNVDRRDACNRALQEKLTFHQRRRLEAELGPRRLERLLERKAAFGQQASIKAFAQKMQRVNAEYAENEDEDEEEPQDRQSEGGNVMKPSCGYYGNKRVWVFDFKSLYPSIMAAFGITYENIVYERKYLDLPGVRYFYVAINRYETVALAVQPGLIPEMLQGLMNSRDAVKKQMKKEKDPFKVGVLNARQLALKVFCNAVYGFCGAGASKGGMLPLKTIMYVVTSLGRFLQKFCVNYAGELYGMPTIYGDTDSAFMLIPFEPNPDIACLTQWLGRQYKMERYISFRRGFVPPSGSTEFTWRNVVDYWTHKSRGKLDVGQFRFEHQVNAVLYLVAEKLCEEMSAACCRHITENTGHTGEHIVLEPENMADKVIMYQTKKNYCYHFWAENDPSKMKKVKVTGMAVVKRDWCLWTRSLLARVQEMLQNDKGEGVKPLLTQELDRLLAGQVPVSQLQVSKGYKGKYAYKHHRLAHVQIVLQIERDTRWTVKDRIRVPIVVIKGDEKLYLRGVTPQKAVEKKLPIDTLYYLKRQFEKPVRKLLTFHPHLFDFEEFFQGYLRRWWLQESNLQSISTARGQKRKLLTLSSLASSRRRRKTRHGPAAAPAPASSSSSSSSSSVPLQKRAKARRKRNAEAAYTSTAPAAVNPFARALEAQKAKRQKQGPPSLPP